MATLSHLPNHRIGRKTNTLYHPFRISIETFFHQNNVVPVASLKEAYDLAKDEPGTIVLDQTIAHAEALGLPKDTKMLVFNDGAITGRQAQARVLMDDTIRDVKTTALNEHLFHERKTTYYHGTVIVGMHEDFMVRAHLCVPKGYANTLYSWMLNFQDQRADILKMYDRSKVIEEGDLYLFSNPDATEVQALFDEKYNCAALLGLRYFGEHKKATLTLAWSLAKRQGYMACHGGLKRFERAQKDPFVMAVFGLSGSGKSTITHHRSERFKKAVVLHDDAFILHHHSLESIALEPAYFDKVANYPTSSSDNDFILTAQNVGVTLNEHGHKVMVTEDIRSGNGRAVKSMYWTDNRVQHITEPITAVFWIMKDDVLPPILKIDDATLASTLGAALATKRSSAEHGANTEKLAFVPYANPFRLYPLEEDYRLFKTLFENPHVSCYILNTGLYHQHKVMPHETFTWIDRVASDDVSWKPFLGYPKVFVPNDISATESPQGLVERLKQRIDFIETLPVLEQLPSESIDALRAWIKNII